VAFGNQLTPLVARQDRWYEKEKKVLWQRTVRELRKKD